jgi:hypothetical protein
MRIKPIADIINVRGKINYLNNIGGIDNGIKISD